MTGLARSAVVRGAGALVLAASATVPAVAPAHAAAEYRYWSFWTADSGAQGSAAPWTYATEGPSGLRPADGGVAGFRFTVSADSARAAEPRAAADFGAVCDSTKAADGRKRVAVVIDFGTAADAPRGEEPPAARTECARVPEDATAGEALAAVAKPLRYDSSALLCAIGGYPKAGCADQVSGSGAADGERRTSEPAAHGSDGGTGSGGPSAGLVGGVAAIAALGAAAVWQARRRRG